MQNPKTPKPRDQAAPPSDAPLSRPRLEQSIGFNIARHLSKSKAPQDRRAGWLGIGRDEWRLFLALHEYGAQPSVRLAELTFLDRAVISRAVSRMERAGHVLRLADAKDGRVTIVGLTAAGEALAAQVADWHFARDAQVKTALTEDELETWLRLNDKIYARLSDLGQVNDDGS